MSITLSQAKLLRRGQILLDKDQHRWKVNGVVKLWKTDPSRIRVPLKHGLYAYDALTEVEFVDGVCDLLTLQDGVS